MEQKFIPRNDVTASQKKMINSLNKVCFGIDAVTEMDPAEGRLFGAVENEGFC